MLLHEMYTLVKTKCKSIFSAKSYLSPHIQYITGSADIFMS